MDTHIFTERLVLRPAAPTDVTAMHAILSDTRAMAYWSSLPHSDIAETAEWLAKMIAIRPEEGEDFAVAFEGRVIGKVGLYRFPEIGFIFHPDYWGRGFAREALTAVLERGFTRHGLEQVEADVDPRNTVSLRLLARLGFREVARKSRTWLIGAEWCDSVYLSLKRSPHWTGAAMKG